MKKRKVLLLFTFLVLLTSSGCFNINLSPNISIYDDDYPILASNDDGKYGYINSKGDFIINAEYNFASDFNGNYAYVEDEFGAYLINTKGKEILNLDQSTYSEVRYYDKYNIWIINGKLYNNDLKSLTAKEEKVEYIDFGFSKLINYVTGDSYIIDKDGKKIYLMDDDEADVEITYSKNDDENYYASVCKNGKIGKIVSLQTGEVLYEIPKEFINDFEISSNSLNYYNIKLASGFDAKEKYIFINNEKIAYETEDDEILSYYSDNYILIENYDNKKYINLDTNEIINEEPVNDIKSRKDYSIVSCNTDKTKRTLIFKNNIISSCEYDFIVGFDDDLYDYIKNKNGKNLIYARNDKNAYVLDMNTKTVVREFDASKRVFDFSIKYDTFILTEEGYNTVTAYNMITEKTLNITGASQFKTGSNYMLAASSNESTIFNNNLSSIYEKKKKY